MTKEETIKRVLVYLSEHSSIAANLTVQDIARAINMQPGAIKNSVGYAMELGLIDGISRKSTSFRATAYSVRRVDGITKKGQRYLKEGL